VHCSIRSHNVGAIPRRTREDAGSAFMTVMATTSILFVLATTLMLMVAYQTQTTGIRVGKVRATHVADAGVNAYLYILKNDPGAYETAPDTGWVAVSGVEKYRVTAVAPSRGTPLTLYSTGVAGDGTVTIAATVRFPTFADYMFLSDASLTLEADAYIDGQVRTNGDIDNKGHILGKVSVGGTATGGGRFDQGYVTGVPTVKFDQLTDDMVRMADAAVKSGSYLGASGALGYRVTVTGATVTIAKITGGITTGDFVTVPVRTLTVPDSGVVYLADKVWVEGTYSVPLTIACESDMYLTGDYMPADVNSTVTSGLIARGNIIVPEWYRSVKEYMTVNAALLSQTGRVYADIKQGLIRERITITGAMAYFDSGGDFGSYDKWTGQPVSGFRQNVYTYDNRLNLYPPPMYPVIRDGSLKVDTWIEDRTPVL
jgi:hypothetical protein